MDWAALPLRQQRTISIRTAWNHPQGFTEPLTIHIPYDTIAQLLRFSPDVIISDELGARTLQATAYRAVGRGTRLVVWAKMSEATEQGRGRLRPVLRRALLRHADAVMVNGASGARYVERLGVSTGKVFCVPQTTDIARFLAVSAQRPAWLRRRFIYCGRLIQLKGLIPFISHLTDLARCRADQRFELWFAGDGPLRSELTEFPRPANLDFLFLGNVSYDRMPEVYGQAGILVFPTLADEWGLVVVEAMAAGLPVLGSLYSQAVDDLVTDGLTGWTFRPDDSVGIRSALGRVLDASAEEIDCMGHRARHRVTDLTPESMTREVMTAIEYAYAHDS